MSKLLAHSYSSSNNSDQVLRDHRCACTFFRQLEHMRHVGIVFVARRWNCRDADGIPEVMQNLVDPSIEFFVGIGQPCIHCNSPVQAPEYDVRNSRAPGHQRRLIAEIRLVTMLPFNKQAQPRLRTGVGCSGSLGLTLPRRTSRLEQVGHHLRGRRCGLLTEVHANAEGTRGRVSLIADPARQLSGSSPNSRSSCEQRHALAIFAAHRMAASRDGSCRIQKPPSNSFVWG